MMLFGRLMLVPVKMQRAAVFVNVGVLTGNGGMRGREFFAHPLGDAGEIEDAEKYKHQADGEFHGEADARRDHNVKHNDGSADEDDGDGMAQSPKGADEGGLRERAFARNDGGDRDHMIGVSGMAHAEEKANKQDGEAAEHKGYRCQSRT